MKPGFKIRYKYPGKLERIKIGKIIDEYERFYLVLNSKGYKECLDKNSIAIGDIQVEVVK